MLKITGMDKLQRDLKRASSKLGDMDGEIGTVRFDPHDPASIEAAIAEAEHLVDLQLGGDADNPILGPLADGMKESVRQDILDRAAAARLADPEEPASDESADG